MGGSAGLDNRPNQGIVINGTAKTICLKLNYGIFSNGNRYFTLDSAESPVLNMYVEDTAKCCRTSLTGKEEVGGYYNDGIGTTYTDPFTISNVSLICGITELSQSAQMLLDSSLGGDVSFDYDAISLTQDTN